MAIEFAPAEEKVLDVTLQPTWIRCEPMSQWYVFRGEGGEWEQVVDSASGYVTEAEVSSQTGFIWRNYPRIQRCGLYFDLSPIPKGSIILAATLTARFAAWKYANGFTSWFPNDHILLDFPAYSWPPSPLDYALMRWLTDEIIRWHYPTQTEYDHLEIIELPEHTINTMQGQPILALAEKCSADHDNIPGLQYTTFGCQTYRAYGGYRAHIDVRIQET